MSPTLQSTVVGFIFMAVGAIASWLISRAYYERSTRTFLAIVGSKPWNLLANIEERTRARLEVLVDGERARELTRLRYEVTNYGHVSILSHAPIRLPLCAGATVVEASIPLAGPAGLQLGLSVQFTTKVPELLISAPILNPGDRFNLELLVRDLDTAFVAAFNVQAPGLEHQIIPTTSAPYSESSRITKFFVWLWAFFPSLLLIYMGIVAIHYLAVFFGWVGMPQVFEMPPPCYPRTQGILGHWFFIGVGWLYAVHRFAHNAQGAARHPTARCYG
ncbi:MAG TPA: hypothetical protein VGC66_14190 [Pyrinomonadaceae bacterium]|jgi:hypothetical protein